MLKQMGSLKMIFICRAGDIARLSKKERDIINDKSRNIEIEDYIQKLSKKQKTQIEEYIEILISEVYFEANIINEKYYCYGFSDGVQQALDSTKNDEYIKKFLNNRLKKLKILTEEEKSKLLFQKVKVKPDTNSLKLDGTQIVGFENYINKLLEKAFESIAITNEKYFTYGFNDGLGITLDSIKTKIDADRRFGK